jgi:predicted dehydrogenase
VSQENKGTEIPRRDFLKTSAAITAATLSSGVLASGVWAQADEKMRVGLIGCGGRGSGAARDAVVCSDGVELCAMGDLFQDRLDKSFANLKEALGDKFKVTKDQCFTGFDNYQKVLATDVNYIILATPPGFRPEHFAACVEAGKHVFMEKPVAVCPTGVRSILATGEKAEAKGLGVVAGTLFRHHDGHLEVIRRIHDGEIGRVLSAQFYYNTGLLWKHDRQPEWSDIEWQIRNWMYFTWLAGDHIVEQNVHRIDTLNWVMNGHPVECLSIGGRQVRTDPSYGHIYDHFTTEFVYPGGVVAINMCRQMDGCENRIAEHVIGTKGTASPLGGVVTVEGKEVYKYDAKGGLGPAYRQEHADLIASIREGKPLNETRQVAESTLTAIMGRMSAYTGQKVTWDFALKESKLNLMRNVTEFGDMPVDEVAMPGKTPLI